VSKAPEMSSGSYPSRNPAGHSGLLDNALGLISAVVAFFEGRFILLAQESKTAAVQLLILVGCVIAALALCLMGYVFLIVSAVVGLAHLLGTSWPVVALVVALLHFIIAGVLLVVARSRITKPMFRDSIDELKKDREWLKTLNQSTS
jgi:uncharacterized membrane protein YqjE